MTAPQFDVRSFPVARLPVSPAKAFFGASDGDPVELVFYTWLLRSADTVVVVDAGLPPAGVHRGALVTGNSAGDPREQFAQIRDLDEALDHWGVIPADVDHVVITQTITYHTGGLLPEHFPRAEVHLALPGLLELLTEDVGHPARHLYFTPPTWSFLLDVAVHGRLHAVDDEAEVCPGVRLRVTGGHHPGSAAVTVTTATGSVCLIETAFREENLTGDHPIGIAEDVAQARREMRRALRSHDQVLAIHDPSHARTRP